MYDNGFSGNITCNKYVLKENTALNLEEDGNGIKEFMAVMKVSD